MDLSPQLTSLRPDTQPIGHQVPFLLGYETLTSHCLPPSPEPPVLPLFLTPVFFPVAFFAVLPNILRSVLSLSEQSSDGSELETIVSENPAQETAPHPHTPLASPKYFSSKQWRAFDSVSHQAFTVCLGQKGKSTLIISHTKNIFLSQSVIKISLI